MGRRTPQEGHRLTTGSRLWRIGYVDDPLGFTPWEYCSWAHRFDDPQREYRTLYAAEQRITCFRETLAAFRPNAKSIAEYQRIFGKSTRPSGFVPHDWMKQLAIAPARLEIHADGLANVDEPLLRRTFEQKHAELLDAHGIDHLDIAQVRSRQRILTQSFSRWLFNRGASGILYRSNLDDLPCVALFEGRATLTPSGEADAIIELPVELVEVCREYELTLPEESTT